MKKTILFMIVILAAIVAGSVSGTAAAENAIQVMALSGTTGLSLVKMFDENPNLGGAAADYTIVKNPDQMVAKIISGEADIAAIPTNTAAVLYNKGIPIQLAAVTNWGVTYIVGRDPAVRSWKDLKGREIAVTGRGAAPDILLRYMLKANGLDPEKDIKIQYYPAPVELAQLIIAGKVDLATLPEPWATEVTQKDNGVKVLLDYQGEWRRLEKRRESYPQSCLVVKASLVRDRPGLVADFIRQAGASSEWVNRYPAEAGILAQNHVFISARAAEAAIPRCNLRFETAGRAKDEIDYYLRVLFGFDPQTTGGRVPDARFYMAN